MSMQNRRSSFSSSTTSSLAKRHASSSENVRKFMAVPPHLAKKRAPLSNITNQRNVIQSGSKSSLSSSSLAPCSSRVAKAKKVNPAGSINNTGFSGKLLPASLIIKSSTVVPLKVTSLPRTEEPAPSIVKSNNVLPSKVTPLPRSDKIAPSIAEVPASSSMDVSKVTPLPRSDKLAPNIAEVPASSSMDVSPNNSDANSVSMDETTSASDSFKSPDVEYIDNNDVPALDSIDRNTFRNLYISGHAETTGNGCSRDLLAEMEMDDKIVNIDDSNMDPQLCATFACDIYKHLRASEAKKRPSTDFMERIQKDINCSMRAILVDWLVEVAEEYRLVPETLYLTVNYTDRYLSGNVMNRQRLQLLGVACMMIAAKYEEICAPQVEEFCYITDNTYFKEEVLEMESAVLNYLKFEMTAPTAKCFLRRFVRAAQGINEAPSMQLECLANYIAELSLLEYSMLCYAPSLIAASAIFLAKYILIPSKRPWSSTLQHYTLYQPSDLMDCVKDLHRLFCNSNSSSLPAIREKYSQHKYKYVAKKLCPPSIPPEFFHSH
ncbi:cyclin-A1-1-like [Mangifera indica]|uniref:cyclin-A1-1-like n=1 Tax=Mangifera indica TaxID=29780 RepID=UPI001CFA3234|nr:cyclin-A1-1-like [Mangifera indica]